METVPPSSESPAPPKWSVWRNLPEIELWQAVTLSCDLDPQEPPWQDALQRSTDYENWFVRGNAPPAHQRWLTARDFSTRLRLAEANYNVLFSPTGHKDVPLRSTTSFAKPGKVLDKYRYLRTRLKVPLTGFATWAAVAFSPVPDEFARLGGQADAVAASTWPWGGHETKLLRELAAAAKEHWYPYDPKFPATAPTNKDVVAWLQERGVSKRVAEVMAQILRADGLKAGPHVNP